jgi:eukaryotic-like serine/threonine-protein kinase
MNKRCKLLGLLTISYSLLALVGVAVNGCNIRLTSADLSSTVAPNVQEHSFEFLIDKQLDIRMPHDPCPKGMVLIDRKNAFFCIDQFEFPNQAGVYPVAALTAYEAVDLCKSVGKRLCEYSEWKQACVGREGFLYSYGRAHKNYCNDHATGYIQPNWGLMYPLSGWKPYAKGLYKGVLNGSEPQCKSDEGVYELLGNVREWTHDAHAPYKYVVPAGYWFGTMQGLPTCNFAIREHSPGFASYEFGARCCLDAQ